MLYAPESGTRSRAKRPARSRQRGFDAGIVALMIPILGMMIPIVALLVRHQQKMAEIMRQPHGDLQEMQLLRGEIAELKQLVHQQAIVMDNLLAATSRANRPVEESVSERIGI